MGQTEIFHNYFIMALIDLIFNCASVDSFKYLKLFCTYIFIIVTAYFKRGYFTSIIWVKIYLNESTKINHDGRARRWLGLLCYGWNVCLFGKFENHNLTLLLNIPLYAK